MTDIHGILNKNKICLHMNINYYTENEILILEFNSIIQMNQIMEKSANNYEGFIKNRIGFNFPSDFVIGTIPYFDKNRHKYVIGYIKGDWKVRKHEMCHAKFYISKKYRKFWIKKWNLLNSNIRQKIIKKLKYMGYSDNVIIDEFQAYMQDNSKIFNTI